MTYLAIRTGTYIGGMKKLRIAIARALLIFPLIPSAASAQYSRSLGLSTGTRVRVTAPAVFPDRATATVLAAQNDTIVVSRSDGTVSLSVPVASIQKLEVSEGRSRLKWGLLGSLGGLLVGGFIGGSTADTDNDLGGLNAMAGFFAGAILGTGAGAVVGALAAPERWTNYPLPSH